ncbi:MAG TPA: hypothetical protein VFI14_11060 [Chryseosolibacter sp.]|jgi:hypothetical protein|nr:hypothetical protein [Chryseosolibacter sp.]
MHAVIGRGRGVHVDHVGQVFSRCLIPVLFAKAFHAVPDKLMGDLDPGAAYHQMHAFANAENEGTVA